MRLMDTLPDEIPDLTDAEQRALYPFMDAAESAREAREYHTYWVYRCYDSSDRLLYVGCATDIVGRFQVHECQWDNPTSAYLNLHAVRTEVEGPIIGKALARKTEREAIGAEAPLLNIHHNKGRGMPRTDVVAFLSGGAA